MSDEKEHMGIMRGVTFGNRDVGRPVLWFSVYTDEALASLQILEIDEAVKLIKAYDVYDIKELEGKPIWVKGERVAGGTEIISRPCIIK